MNFDNVGLTINAFFSTESHAGVLAAFSPISWWAKMVFLKLFHNLWQNSYINFMVGNPIKKIRVIAGHFY